MPARINPSIPNFKAYPRFRTLQLLRILLERVKEDECIFYLYASFFGDEDRTDQTDRLVHIRLHSQPH